MSSFRGYLENETVVASAPCRLDMGGTLDLSTFYLPLRHLNPCTFNVAIDMRTRVRLLPHKDGRIKISSRGFDPVDVESQTAPFSSSVGLMLAVAAFFNADGVHIEIDSASPPRSALGGSVRQPDYEHSRSHARRSARRNRSRGGPRNKGTVQDLLGRSRRRASRDDRFVRHAGDRRAARPCRRRTRRGAGHGR